MKVPEDIIAHVVSEASTKMTDAQYISGKVDRLRAAQPNIFQYVLAHQAEFTVEGVVTILFYTSLLLESVSRALGRHPAVVDFQDLDHAASKRPTAESLAEIEPNLASFIATNVELEQGPQQSKLAQQVLTHVAGALTI